ncbi:MAG: hypothetical protein QNK84_02765 [Flavobacteriales bacterium]|jgi:hypothetical protein
MTDKFEEQELSDKTKNKQPLTGKQKLLFGMVCWGVQSWSQAKSFKANGYDQKYIDARKAMHTGLAIYGLGITLFILLLLFL